MKLSRDILLKTAKKTMATLSDQNTQFQYFR